MTAFSSSSPSSPSSLSRAANLARMEDAGEPWDLVVIGGGATGLGTAVDAAARGYRTLLLEARDFAEGTSSRSTKLIHGGVRYLRQGQVGLVRDSLHERGRLLRNAPHLVHPLPFVIPAFHWHEPFFYGAGLTLYDLLAGKLGIGRSRPLSAARVAELLPNFRVDLVRGGTYYYDGQFDDARLAIALARTAAGHGACLLNHVAVSGLLREGGTIRGVRARERFTGREHEIRARAVINATGVFTDEVRRLETPDIPPLILPSQGIHLVFDASFLSSENALIIPKTDDGRVLFAIPWHNRLLLGTTDTAGVPVSADPRPREEEIDYLLDHAGRYLERAPARADIRASFAGLRPLVRPSDPSLQSSAVSRDHTLLVSPGGLVTMTGGKWTTYRKMAEDTVDRAGEIAGLEPRPCPTRDLPLHDDAAEVEAIRSSSPDSPLHPDLPYTAADLTHAIHHEMPQTLEDLLSRRLRCRLLDDAATAEIAPRAARELAAHLGRDEAWIEAELANCDGAASAPSSSLVR